MIRMRCQQQEEEISKIENQALQQRFSEILDNLVTELYEKEKEVSFIFNFKDAVNQSFSNNFAVLFQYKELCKLLQ